MSQFVVIEVFTNPIAETFMKKLVLPKSMRIATSSPLPLRLCRATLFALISSNGVEIRNCLHHLTKDVKPSGTVFNCKILVSKGLVKIYS